MMNVAYLMTFELFDVVSATNVLLLLALLGHLLIRFWNKRAHPFFLPWVLFWGCFIAHYLFYYSVGYFGAYHSLLMYSLYTIVELLDSLFLVIATEFFSLKGYKPKSLKSTTIHIWVKWSLVFTVLILVSLFPLPSWKIVIVNYAAFLSIALYTGRFTAVFPKTKQWIIIVLYIYAGL